MKTQQKILNFHTLFRQGGLTLIELAVVLAILVALSTLMIPYVGNYIGKAEVSTSNYNASAVLGALQQYYALYGAYPNRLDLLSDGDQPVCYLDDTVIAGRPAYVGTTTYTMSANCQSTNFGTMMDAGGAMAASMAKVGVTMYFYMKTGIPVQDKTTLEWYVQTGKSKTPDPTALRFDATFGAQDPKASAATGPNGEVVLAPNGENAATVNVMWVSDNCGGYWMDGHPECISNILGYRNCKIDKNGVCPPLKDSLGNTVDQSGSHMLILLGVNQNNDMVGKTITTAPVHFPENKSTNPGLVYSRFLAVFDVDMRSGCQADSIGCDPGKLVGVVVGPSASRGWQTATTGMARAFKPAE